PPWRPRRVTAGAAVQDRTAPVRPPGAAEPVPPVLVSCPSPAPGRGGLAGLTEAAPVVSDDPVPGLQQYAFLLLPGVPVQRVAVDQHHRLPGAVVLVVDPDGLRVLLPDGDLSHCLAFLSGGKAFRMAAGA